MENFAKGRAWTSNTNYTAVKSDLLITVSANVVEITLYLDVISEGGCLVMRKLHFQKIMTERKWKQNSSTKIIKNVFKRPHVWIIFNDATC